MSLTGAMVSFTLKAIEFPAPEAVLLELHGDDVLTGEVLASSDSAGRSFVVVRVEGIEQPVVVPIERVRLRSGRDGH